MEDPMDKTDALCKTQETPSAPPLESALTASCPVWIFDGHVKAARNRSMAQFAQIKICHSDRTKLDHKINHVQHMINTTVHPDESFRKMIIANLQTELSQATFQRAQISEKILNATADVERDIFAYNARLAEAQSFRLASGLKPDITPEMLLDFNLFNQHVNTLYDNAQRSHDILARPRYSADGSDAEGIYLQDKLMSEINYINLIRQMIPAATARNLNYSSALGMLLEDPHNIPEINTNTHLVTAAVCNPSQYNSTAPVSYAIPTAEPITNTHVMHSSSPTGITSPAGAVCTGPVGAEYNGATGYTDVTGWVGATGCTSGPAGVRPSQPYLGHARPSPSDVRHAPRPPGLFSFISSIFNVLE